MSLQIDSCVLAAAEAATQIARPIRREGTVAAAISCDGKVLAMPRLAVAYPAILTMQQVLEKVEGWRLWLLGKCRLDS